MNQSHELEQKIIDLRQTVAWMDLVLASVNQGIFVLDESWRIVFINQWMSDITGLSRISLLGEELKGILTNGVAELPDKKTVMTPQAVSRLNGVYEIERLNYKEEISLQTKYIKHMNQVVCIVTPVSPDMQTEEAMRQFFKEIANLRREVARLQSKKN